MHPSTPWQPGETAVFRGIDQKVLWAFPATVVQDTPQEVVLYLPAGVMGKNTDHRPIVQEMLAPQQLRIVDCRWKWTDVLFFLVPGEPYSTYLMWETGTRTIDCWYINLQEPFRRTALGFDTLDQLLDIVISPDRLDWHWKDEDEFDEAQRLGLYSPAQAQAIRAAGKQALQRFFNERRTFFDPWEAWQPDPAWKKPLLPAHWDELFQ